MVYTFSSVVIYSPFDGCRGTIMKFGLLANNDSWASMRRDCMFLTHLPMFVNAVAFVVLVVPVLAVTESKWPFL